MAGDSKSWEILHKFREVSLAAGPTIIIFGLWLLFGASTRILFKTEGLESEHFSKGVAVVIAFGVVVFIVGLIGKYGIEKKNRTILKVEKKHMKELPQAVDSFPLNISNHKVSELSQFAVLLALLIVGEFAIGVIVCIKSDEVVTFIAKLYDKVYELYERDVKPHDSVTTTLKYFHDTLYCCGVSEKIQGKIKETCPEPVDWNPIPTCTEIITTVFESRASQIMGIFFGTGAFLITTLTSTIKILKQPQEEPQETSSSVI